MARMSPVGLRRELVGAVAGADGDGQRVELGGLHEVGGFLGVGQHLAVVQLAVGADAVFLAGLAGFQVAQAAQFAFDRHADRVRPCPPPCASRRRCSRSSAGVLPSSCSEPSIITEPKPRPMAPAQTVGAGAVVLVHDQRNVRVGLDRGLDQVLDEGLHRRTCGRRRWPAG